MPQITVILRKPQKKFFFSGPATSLVEKGFYLFFLVLKQPETNSDKKILHKIFGLKESHLSKNNDSVNSFKKRPFIQSPGPYPHPPLSGPATKKELFCRFPYIFLLKYRHHILKNYRYVILCHVEFLSIFLSPYFCLCTNKLQISYIGFAACFCPCIYFRYLVMTSRRTYCLQYENVDL